MNTDPPELRRSHLDLSDLVAGAAGQPVDDQAKAHLDSCQECQLEVQRWSLVADGVRSLAAASVDATEPGWPQPAPKHGRAPWRRALPVAASAAAAVVLLIGVGAVTGTVHLHLSGHSSKAALTAVTGCSQFEQADGALEQVNGANLVLQTAGGQAVTVVTTSSTFVSMSGPLLADITDGEAVRVRGSQSGSAVEAALITLGQPFSAVGPGPVVLQGTVADASTTGFDLLTSSGATVAVTTSSSTLVVVAGASLGQLQLGTTIYAVGTPGPGAILSALAVGAITQLPGSQLELHTHLQSCSARAVVEALGAISTAPAPAG